jgi:hypothetical protein
MKKLLIKSFLFLCLLLLIVSSILDPIFKDVSINSKTFNEFNSKVSNTLDVLIIGSSHAKNTYNPKILDSVFNIRSYNLATGGQNLMATHILLKDVLKKTKPKLLIVDLFPAVMKVSNDEKTKSSQLKVLDYTNFSFEKLDMINQMYEFKEFPSVFHETIRNNSKWYNRNWLGSQEFVHNDKILMSNGWMNTNKQIDKKGRLKFKDFKTQQNIFLNTKQPSKQEILSFEEKNEHLINIIKLCKTNNVDLLFVSAPYFNSIYKKGLHRIHIILEGFLKKENVNFIDFNKEYINMNLTLDDFWNEGHLNANGSSKVTLNLSKSLNDQGYFTIKNQEYYSNALSGKIEAIKNTATTIQPTALSKTELINKITKTAIKHKANRKIEEKDNPTNLFFYQENNTKYILIEQSINNNLEFKNKKVLLRGEVYKTDFDKRPIWQLETNKNKIFWDTIFESYVFNEKSYLLLTLSKKGNIDNFKNFSIFAKDKNGKPEENLYTVESVNFKNTNTNTNLKE